MRLSFFFFFIRAFYHSNRDFEKTYKDKTDYHFHTLFDIACTNGQQYCSNNKSKRSWKKMPFYIFMKFIGLVYTTSNQSSGSIPVSITGTKLKHPD